jgi:ribA/ribD-fused uncharacterized protein
MGSNITVRDGYALFWGQWPSNWENSPFTLGGIRYNCVEQYMMAEKARLFGDNDSLSKIMNTSDPSDQKRYGRGVASFDEAKWAVIRYNVVLRGTLEKYRQNESLKMLLLATENWIFVEASPKDVVWGIGLDAKHPDATIPSKWKGLNLLGNAITEARSIIRKEMGIQ